MAYTLIGADCLVTITLGGPVDGAPTWEQSATDIKALARTVEIDEGVSEIDVAALGDQADRFRINRTNGRVRLVLEVPDTGPKFAGKNGNYAKVSWKPITGGTEHLITGAIISRRITSNNDEAQTETIEVKAGADGA